MTTTRRLLVALTVSVGVNLFFGGFLLARRFHHESRGRSADTPRGAEMAQGVEMRGAGMPRDAEAPWRDPALQGVWRERQAELAPEIQETRQARKAAFDVLTGEPFDRPALEARLKDVRARTDALQEKLHRALVDKAASLPVEERRRLLSSPRRRNHDERRRER